MRTETSVVQVDFGHSGTCRMESSRSNKCFQSGFVHLLQNAAASVRLRRLDPDGLSRRLAHLNERDSLSVNAEEGVERVLEVTSENVDLFLWLNMYKAFKEKKYHKLPEPEVTLMNMAASVR